MSSNTVRAIEESAAAGGGGGESWVPDSRHGTSFCDVTIVLSQECFNMFL
jgi:hypothetical protein